MATPMELVSMRGTTGGNDNDIGPRFRPVRHLFDIALRAGDRGEVVFAATGALANVQSLVVQVRRCGADDCDVRILSADGARYTRTLRELADRLGCDVYATPNGADLVAASPDAPLGRPGEAIAVDRATGKPVPWLRVRPPEVAAASPAWFVRVGGAVRRRPGIAVVPLANGVAFATRRTFADLCVLADWLGDDPPGMATVVVGNREGAFEIGRYDGSMELVDGVRLAELVTAIVGSVGKDVRLLVQWPSSAKQRAGLEAQVARLAAALGSVVWTPEHEDATGEAGQAYLPRTFRGWPPVPQRKLSTEENGGQHAGRVWHGIPWLPPLPPVNREPIDLLAWTTCPVGEALRAGLPTAEPFLLLYRDPERLAAHQLSGHLLSLSVPAGSAVELDELDELDDLDDPLPSMLSHRVRETPVTHLLPLAWLPGVTVTAGYDLDGAGGFAAAHRTGSRPLAVIAAIPA